MKRICTAILGILVFVNLYSNNAEPYYYSTTIKDGDGITNILSRYMLSGSRCNYNKFLEMNDMKSTSMLFKHKEYKLPVKIYTYDGKSIRSTVGTNDIDKALRIQNYNEELLERGLRKSSYKESKILWVPHNEIECSDNVKDTNAKERSPNNESKLSVSSKTEKYATESLFGADYERFEILDYKLEGHVYYITSGHGGPDPGAVCDDCPKTMCEDEYAYDVGLRLARNLMQHGATVYMMVHDRNDGIRDELYLKCDRDEVLHNGDEIPLGQIARLEQRVTEINRLYKRHKKKGAKVQKAIELHIDSRSKDKNQDVFFYYYNQNGGGQELTESVFNKFEEKYRYYRKDKEYKGYMEDRNLYMLRHLKPAGVYVELANIRNEFDHKRLIHSYNRQALANWLFEGMTKDSDK